jgi:two-component system KDP operon response regulator KdpE
MKILIADDDPQLLRALRVTLGARGYEIVTATNGREALSAALEHRPDLYMLDLGMPKLDGIQVISELRGWTDAPILVVSGRTGAADKVEALDFGADDYVTKPFFIDELLARIRALTRRVPTPEAEPLVTLGNVTVDVASKSVVRAEPDGPVYVRLTPTEWRILELLVRNAGRLVTRQTLLRDIWGPAHVTESGYLRLYIAQLRKKLEPDPGNPVFILTEAGMGYRLVLEPSGIDPNAGGRSSA